MKRLSLYQEVEKLHAELIDQRREHEDKFASALEEARVSYDYYSQW